MLRPLATHTLQEALSSAVAPRSAGACGVLTSTPRGGRLAVKPREDLGTPVADGASDTEAARPGPYVTPIAQSSDGHAHHVGDLLQRQQFVVGVCGFGLGVSATLENEAIATAWFPVVIATLQLLEASLVYTSCS